MEEITGQPAERSERIDICATASQAALLRKAALVRQKTLSEYIIETACGDAERTLLGRNVLTTDQTAGKRFLELLDEPACETEGLERLRDVVSPWDCHAAKESWYRHMNGLEAKTDHSGLQPQAASGKENIIGQACRSDAGISFASDESVRSRTGFLEGRYRVPDDFDRIDSEEIGSLFEDRG